MADQVGELLFLTLTSFDTVNITNKLILGVVKSKTNLEGNVLGTGINTCISPDPRAPLRGLHSGLD